MRRLSNCGSRAQLLRGMWDPPRPGLEPVSPALAGRFSTTAPPGKPLKLENSSHCLSHAMFSLVYESKHMLSPLPVAPRHVGSSRTRARTRVPCIDRQILNHCATREVPGSVLDTS
ncbi:hypothetical protein J1605_001821 [Eschrichtius robustus]|uniref:Uncharacterized protein n=1 Tax=Eschrichtius robustus TaxID=9764 RepID=A0AB34HZB2_ESCRO|nr:hypothetical protein J1605_001821 [Eschrichtius robustus]